MEIEDDRHIGHFSFSSVQAALILEQADQIEKLEARAVKLEDANARLKRALRSEGVHWLAVLLVDAGPDVLNQSEDPK